MFNDGLCSTSSADDKVLIIISYTIKNRALDISLQIYEVIFRLLFYNFL
jgi:hypothetical protein